MKRNLLAKRNILLLLALVSLHIMTINKGVAQISGDHNSIDRTNDENKIWIVDNDNDGTNESYQWWRNGGGSQDDLMMRINSDKTLNIYNHIQFQLANSALGIYSVTNSTDSPSWIEFWNTNGIKELVLGGERISFYVNSNSTGYGSLIMKMKLDARRHHGILDLGPSFVKESSLVNVDRIVGYNDLRFVADADNGFDIDMFMNSEKLETDLPNIIFNYGTHDDLCQVSVNTDARVEQAALTIAGATYIGPDAEKASTGTLDKYAAEYLDDYNLWVEDGIVTEDIVLVSVNDWKDNVFEEDYEIMPLEEVKTFIEENKHLPGIPSERKVKEEGYSLSEINAQFLEKIEELMLHTIRQEEEINKLRNELKELQKKE